MTVLGAAGGFAGAIISELIHGGEEGRFFRGSINKSSGVWFALAMLGVGAAMSLSQGLLEKNVEKSKMAALRTIPASLVGGFLAGVIAQSVYSALYSENFNVVPRAIGWGVAGCLAGLSIGIGFGSLTRIRNATIGGAIGGVAGGVAFNVIASMFASGVMSRFIGLTVIGTMIGLAIALIDLVTTSAFLEMATPEGPPVRFPLIGRTHVIGCANSVSVAILRDPAVREQHVRLDIQGSTIGFSCINGAPPVVVNGQQAGQGVLSNGDVMVVGNTALRVSTSKSYRIGVPGAAGQQMPHSAGQPGPTPWQPAPAARPTIGMPGGVTAPGAPTPGAPTASPAPQAPSQPAQRPIIQIKPPNQ